MNQGDVLRDILITVKKTNSNVDALRRETKEQEERILQRSSEEVDEKIQKSIQKLSSEVGKQLRDVMEVIQNVERREHQKIAQELKEHKENAINGVLLLKQSLVR